MCELLWLGILPSHEGLEQSLVPEIVALVVRVRVVDVVSVALYIEKDGAEIKGKQGRALVLPVWRTATVPGSPGRPLHPEKPHQRPLRLRTRTARDRRPSCCRLAGSKFKISPRGAPVLLPLH